MLQRYSKGAMDRVSLGLRYSLLERNRRPTPCFFVIVALHLIISAMGRKRELLERHRLRGEILSILPGLKRLIRVTTPMQR